MFLVYRAAPTLHNSIYIFGVLFALNGAAALNKSSILFLVWCPSYLLHELFYVKNKKNLKAALLVQQKEHIHNSPDCKYLNF